MMFVMCVLCFFFFKQKTAYEMRISDWSSDVCSSDLVPGAGDPVSGAARHHQYNAVGHRLMQAPEEVAVEIGTAPFAAAGIHIEFEEGIPVFVSQIAPDRKSVV